MRPRGGLAVALAALMLLGAGACSESGSGDDEVSVVYGSNDVAVSRPTLRVVPGGAWLLSASFAWDACGERACFAFDERRHGGPDVFGVYLDRPPVKVESAKLILRGSCESVTTLGRDEAVTGEAGAFFLVQDRTDKSGDCDRGGEPGREFNMASGEIEVLVRPVEGAPCEGTVSVTPLFAHSYRNTGRDVKVDAGRKSDRNRIDWGAEATHQFQNVGPGGALYDCAGAEKN